MSEFYQATFRWPHRDASNVIVTGSFDGWSCSRYLTKSKSGTFEGIIQIPWGEKVAYKYIVDGRWATTDDRPTEMDNEGNLNNVYRAPARSESPFKPAPISVPKPVTKTEAQTESGTEGSTVGAVGAVGAVTAAVVGVVETAKQAAVDMVEAMAPGTTDIPETPVVEPPKPEPTPVPEAAQVSEVTPVPAPTHAPEPTPAPVPEPSQPEVAVTDTTAAILPSEPAPVAPIVPITILPLSTEPPSVSVTAPLADVSESKPLDTTVVEGTSPAVAPSLPASAPTPENAPSTHVPAPVSGAVDEKPTPDIAGPSEEKKLAANGIGLSADKPAVDDTPAINGTQDPKPVTTDGPTPTTTKPELAAVNGAEQDAAVNGKTTATATTPTKEKKMRFPSLSSRSSKHSRTRSSAETTSTSPSTRHGASELGERTSQAGNGDGKDTVSSRFTSSQRQKRTSIFGKLKDVFSHHKNEPPSS